MTRYQAIRISRMIQNGLTSQEYHDAYGELLKSCSDSEPCLILKPQPTVTISGSSTATPIPPSTPTPLGPQWWKERQAEALREQIEIIADKNLKIETLTNQVELLMKRIKEDREHWDNKAVIDNGIREHNNELVAANGEIYEALRHWGLEQSEPCSLVNNVKHVIQLCAERGKRCDEQGAEIKELKKDRNASIIASNQILGALNESGLRQYDGSLADNVVDVIKQCAAQEKKTEGFRKVVRDRNDEIAKLTKRIDVMERAAQTRQQFDETDRVLMEKKDKEIESLKKQIEVRLHFTQQDREIIAKRNTEIADLRKQVSTLSKQVSQRDMTIAVLNKQIDQTDKLCDEEMRETEDLKKQLVVAGKKRKSIVDVGNNLREVMAVIINNYSLDFGDGLLAKNAIALWEDNTTP